MAFPVDLTAVLTGASVNTLRRWSREELVVPEIRVRRPMLYSFRDLHALRSVCYLRSEVSLQKIKTAFANLPEQDLLDHPSEHRFATDGKTVVVWTEDGFIDLVNNPGQFNLVTMNDIYRSFQRGKRRVVDFRHPRKHLEVHQDRLGGWPTILGTRVPFDAVANLFADGDVSADEVTEFYPTVGPGAVEDAISFQQEVREMSA
ncbi:DUF433 domain-containing protein [Rhodococcus sp. PAMC28707]|uniref:DUF433 domain-containing protein n=1 Tax=unclassified Rhodococcus (in: high G+C Gram-positive bacteria) TaxID=192944 RepID=UPI00109D99EE|nr:MULTISPECIES: DUF433 domain-containing protein [unclassified Rhodococcus (in: high G+C Gram-positive bacteria)]QCB49198.1 DUF433 domain-containing protein [Rhodococcus sp. PAMC28705]QCB59114.1 DUF433 domain-containing protein [Rhodococcus sp. PAMC28707]